MVFRQRISGVSPCQFVVCAALKPVGKTRGYKQWKKFVIRVCIKSNSAQFNMSETALKLGDLVW